MPLICSERSVRHAAVRLRRLRDAPGMIRRGLAGAVITLSCAAPLHAQDPVSLTARLAAMTAVTGYEQDMVDTLLSLVPGARRDRAGSAVLTLGAGSPRRLVVCPLDEPGYVVGGIRADGYLTLRRVGGRPPGPLFDQQLEGQRVTVYGRQGARPGVVAVRSTHLARGRNPNEDPFTVDNAFVDVGAASPDETSALGITVLSPLTLAKRPHRYGDGLLAAPAVGRRAACAALVLATQGSPKTAGIIVVGFAVEQNLTMRGLLTLANAAGPFEETLIVDDRAGPPGSIGVAPDSALQEREPRLGRVTRWALGVRYPDTPVETVALRDVAPFAAKVREWMGGAR